MSTMSPEGRRELAAAVTERYQRSTPAERGRILDEFVALTGYHRKHAIRVLNGDSATPAVRRGRRSVYDEAMTEGLVVLCAGRPGAPGVELTREAGRREPGKAEPRVLPGTRPGGGLQGYLAGASAGAGGGAGCHARTGPRDGGLQAVRNRRGRHRPRRRAGRPPERGGPTREPDEDVHAAGTGRPEHAQQIAAARVAEDRRLPVAGPAARRPAGRGHQRRGPILNHDLASGVRGRDAPATGGPPRRPRRRPTGATT